MIDFYNLLAKHFGKEATVNEEAKISSFKKQNPLEYKALKQIWEADVGFVEVVNFNKEQALKKIEKQVKERQGTKVVPLFSLFRKIAAAVVLLIATATIGYFVLDNVTEKTMIVVSNIGNTKKGERVLLADGSIVWLNNNATLSYPNRFKNNKREVVLSGEAFFEVTKDKTRPFTIKVNGTDVTVLGTSFNIKEDTLQTIVSVKTGKVNVKAAQLNKSVVVMPNYTAEVSSTSLDYFKTKNINYLAWKTGVFEFEGASFQQVITDLNTFYEVKLEIEDIRTLPSCLLTAKFNNESITKILEILELTCDIEIKKENNIYKIKSQ